MGCPRPVRARSRARTRSARSRRAAARRRRRRCPVAPGPGAGWDSNPAGLSPRAASSSEAGSAESRLATNASTDRELGSTQCASSTATSTGWSSAKCASHATTSRRRRNAFGGYPRSSIRSSLSSSASGGDPPAGWVSRSTSAAYGRSRSVTRPVIDSTSAPWAAYARAAVDRTEVFPSPGMPRTTAVREPSSSNDRRRAKAASRPTSPSSSPAHNPAGALPPTNRKPVQPRMSPRPDRFQFGRT